MQQNIYFTNNLSGFKDTLNINLNNPCAFLPKDTILEVNIKSNYLSRETDPTLFPFNKLSQTCTVDVNGQRAYLRCEWTKEKLLLYGLFKEDYF